MKEILNHELMEDPDDLGLQAVMGTKFQDKTQESTTVGKGEVKPDWGKKDRRREEPVEKAVDASWAPMKPQTTDRQKLVSCAKGTTLYGGISALLFYWQQAGLLDSRAAVPSFIIIALLTGLKIGSCMARG